MFDTLLLIASAPIVELPADLRYEPVKDDGYMPDIPGVNVPPFPGDTSEEPADWDSNLDVPTYGRRLI